MEDVALYSLIGVVVGLLGAFLVCWLCIDWRWMRRWALGVVFNVFVGKSKLPVSKKAKEATKEFCAQAEKVRADDCDAIVRVSEEDGPGSYALVALPSLMESVKKLPQYKTKRPAQEAILDELLQAVLPFVKTRDNNSPGLEDLVVMDMYTAEGAYFPVIHNDMQWSLFPGADGVQVWYLLYSTFAPHLGSVYVMENEAGVKQGADAEQPVDVEQAAGAVPPCYRKISQRSPCKVTFTENGVMIAGSTGKIFKPEREELFETYDTASDAGLKPVYVDAKPGDCLLFNKFTLHMSDPIGHMLNAPGSRRAVNLRVLVRPAGTPVPMVDHHPTLEKVAHICRLLKKSHSLRIEAGPWPTPYSLASLRQLYCMAP